jgi:hypothetical protein
MYNIIAVVSKYGAENTRFTDEPRLWMQQLSSHGAGGAIL